MRGLLCHLFKKCLSPLFCTSFYSLFSPYLLYLSPYHPLIPLFPISYLPALSFSPYLSLSLLISLCFSDSSSEVCTRHGGEWELCFFMVAIRPILGKWGGMGEERGEKTGARILSPHALTMRTEQQRGSSQARAGEREAPGKQHTPGSTHAHTHTHSTHLH